MKKLLIGIILLSSMSSLASELKAICDKAFYYSTQQYACYETRSSVSSVKFCADKFAGNEMDILSCISVNPILSMAIDCNQSDISQFLGCYEKRFDLYEEQITKKENCDMSVNPYKVKLVSKKFTGRAFSLKGVFSSVSYASHKAHDAGYKDSQCYFSGGGASGLNGVTASSKSTITCAMFKKGSKKRKADIKYEKCQKIERCIENGIPEKFELAQNLYNKLSCIETLY